VASVPPLSACKDALNSKDDISYLTRTNVGDTLVSKALAEVYCGIGVSDPSARKLEASARCWAPLFEWGLSGKLVRHSRTRTIWGRIQLAQFLTLASRLGFKRLH